MIVMELDLNSLPERRPTEKMLNSLDTIIKWLGLDIPSECYLSFSSCSNFLNKYLAEAVSTAQYSWHVNNQKTHIAKEKPHDGKRKYYADGIVCYDASIDRYISEAEYNIKKL